MRLRIGHDALAEAVAWVARALPTRPVIPILAGLLLEAGEGGAANDLTLSCFDYDVSARVGAEAAVAEPGRALVAGRLLAEIARSLPSRPVDIASDGDTVILSSGSARFTLLTLPAEDFPALPSLPPPAGTIDGGWFAAAVAQVAVAASRDDTLPMLTGVLVDIDGSDITLVATDRYRMAVRDLDWQPAQPGIRTSALIPARTLADATKTMAVGTEVAISLAAQGQEPRGQEPRGQEPRRQEAVASAGAGLAGGADGMNGLIGFDDGGRRLTTRLLGTEFVTYRSRFPREFGCRARLAAGPLGEAVKRVALVADRESRLLLTFGAGELVIETGSSEGSRAVETIEAEFEGAEGFAIAFKPQYLLDGIRAAAVGGRAGTARADAEPTEAEPADAAQVDGARGGAVRDGAVPDGAVRDGAVRDGAVRGDAEPTETESATAESSAREGFVTLEFTTPGKPTVITGSPGFKYLLAPMR
jgi:DNA polymerase-3 subunit beta